MWKPLATGLSASAFSLAFATGALAQEVCDGGAGLELPPGFCATVFAEGVPPEGGRLRHIAVAPNGDVYAAVMYRRNAEASAEARGVVGLRDSDGDGAADQSVIFAPEGGTGLEIGGGHLYFATNSAVLRYQLSDELRPQGPPDTLVFGLPDEYSHSAKSLALGPDGRLWVNIGSPTNACQPIGQDRQEGVRGMDPCPQLETRAGVWLFESDRTGQAQAQGSRWATGIRNAVALAYNTSDGELYAVQHGRDQLNAWPGFSDEDNARKPAEELQRLTRGSDFGWPYCYYDPAVNRRVLGPEYGGAGEPTARCAEKDAPLLTFPAHWAPNDLVFYDAEHFPEPYRNGAFIAFHGSWNRAPLPQGGSKVVFVPFRDGSPVGSSSVFVDGFARPDPQPGTAPHRPMGLAVAPDGALYISDSSGGTIWRVEWRGD